jgi:hypothetical protein
MKSVGILIGMAAAIIAGGCGTQSPAGPPDPKILGMWRTTLPAGVGPGGDGGHMTLAFNANGTADETTDTPNHFYRVECTYTTQDGVLTQNFVSGTSSGQTYNPPGPTDTSQYAITPSTLTISENGPNGVVQIVFQKYVP